MNKIDTDIQRRVDVVPHCRMREFMVAGKSVILINEGGKYFAVGGKCPHYNGSLIDGKILF
jgi:nitrite reductase/ring-hydroxylating ferredoxin subunit